MCMNQTTDGLFLRHEDAADCRRSLFIDVVSPIMLTYVTFMGLLQRYQSHLRRDASINLTRLLGPKELYARSASR